MLLNQSFFSLSWFQNQQSLLCFVFACTLRFQVFLFFFTFPSRTTARSSQSFYTWWLNWGNPMPEENCNQARELPRPQVPHLFFLGSLDVFKGEKLGCNCSFPLKTVFSFEEYFGKQIAHLQNGHCPKSSQQRVRYHLLPGTVGFSLPNLGDFLHKQYLGKVRTGFQVTLCYLHPGEQSCSVQCKNS